MFRARQRAARPLFLRAASAPYLPALMVAAAPACVGWTILRERPRARRPTGGRGNVSAVRPREREFAPPANGVQSVIPDPAPLQPCCSQPLPCNPANLSLLFS